MFPSTSRFRRRTAALAAALAGSAVLFAAIPTRGEPNQPSVRFTVSAAARRGRHRVQFDLTLPPPLQYVRLPRVRVLDAKGELTELWPMYVTRGAPAWTGFQELRTKNYAPGTYRVRVEVDYLLPNGKQDTFITPAATLVVPAR